MLTITDRIKEDLEDYSTSKTLWEIAPDVTSILLISIGTDIIKAESTSHRRLTFCRYNNMYAYEYFKTYMTAAHKRFPNYPIYITEFGDNSNSGDAQTQTFLKQVLPWMDAGMSEPMTAYKMRDRGVD